MFKVKGESVDPTYMLFEFGEVFIEYDGIPFSAILKGGRTTMLAHWLDTNTDCDRWLVSPIKRNLFKLFKSGELSFRDTLCSAYLSWIVDVSGDDVVSCWLVAPEDIPDDVLPEKDIYLGMFREESS